jgi:hypothetical protein
MTVTFDPDDSRDYIAEMNAVIEAAVPEGDYIAPILGAELAEKLKANDPELLAGWLWTRAQAELSDTFARRSNSLRQHARVMGPRRAFADAAEEFERTGDPRVLRTFQTEYVVNSGNLRRKVADMTGPDHRFVADSYGATAKSASMLAAFHRAVAKKVGDQRTADVFTQDQYDAMLRSLMRGPERRAA